MISFFFSHLFQLPTKVLKGVLLGGGRDNKVLNNIFINCQSIFFLNFFSLFMCLINCILVNVYMDARGLGLGPTNNISLYNKYSVFFFIYYYNY